MDQRQLYIVQKVRAGRNGDNVHIATTGTTKKICDTGKEKAEIDPGEGC